MNFAFPLIGWHRPRYFAFFFTYTSSASTSRKTYRTRTSLCVCAAVAAAAAVVFFFAHYKRGLNFRTVAVVVVYSLGFFPRRDSYLPPLLLFLLLLLLLLLSSLLLLFRHDNSHALSTLTRSHYIMLLPLFTYPGMRFVILLIEVYCYKTNYQYE